MNNRDALREILRAREAFANARLYKGILPRVAKQIGRSIPHVHQVLAGARRSPAIERALAKEIQQIEREAARKKAA
jgi:predicted trehalose synthase